MQFNQLKYISHQVQSSLSSSLVSLNLCGNLFTKFPYEQGMFPKLERLNIIGNHIDFIPGWIGVTIIKKIEIEWKFVAHSPMILADLGMLSLI